LFRRFDFKINVFPIPESAGAIGQSLISLSQIESNFAGWQNELILSG
jgi:hypothetical protein